MFEIAPFTSFSELLDLEDFLGRNSKLDKFKKMENNRLYLQHRQLLTKHEIQLFSRFFNFSGFCSRSADKA